MKKLSTPTGWSKHPHVAFLNLAALTLTSVSGRAFASTPTSNSPRIDYATMQFIAPADSSEVIAGKAAKVLPRPNQTEWMRLERTFFLHFGSNTFRGVEWGNSRDSPAIFNPTSLDANQWVTAMKNANGALLNLVSKHHDGLCLWPTHYTAHSVASSPWRGGVLVCRKTSQECRQLGRLSLQLGRA